MLYTLHLRLSTPYTKGESSVACVLRHVLHNTNKFKNNWLEILSPYNVQFILIVQLNSKE
jgi:hypothetical protein